MTLCCERCRLAKMGMSNCLSALIQSCGTQLDFRHKCNGGQTAEQAAEANQQHACTELLRQASAFGTDTPPPKRHPTPPSAASQAASMILDPSSMLPLSYQYPPLRPEQQRQQQLQQQQLHQQQQQQLQQQQLMPGAMPGLFPLLANMQGQTSAMLHLTMQPSHMYGGSNFSGLPPPLSAPTSVWAPPPTDAASIAASQRASMESAISNTRPSLDDASMLSRLYPSSSLDSSFSHARMSIDDPQHRMSTGSRRSSVSLSSSDSAHPRMQKRAFCPPSLFGDLRLTQSSWPNCPFQH